MKKIRMKRAFVGIFMCAILLGLSGCGGNVRNVEIKECHSDIYTEEDIESAIDVVFAYFKENFSGCTLNEIGYAGDERTERESGYYLNIEGIEADEIIVLVSSFDVDSSGGDGSLEPNETYEGWSWLLVRKKNGKWRHYTHGYG